MPGGRPKAKLDLPRGWQKKILDLYAEGASDIEIRSMIWEWRKGFSDDLWYRWIKEEPEFAGVIKKGRILCQSWWEKEGRRGIKDKNFSHVGWYMNMKNRFGWSDRHDHTTNGKDVTGPVKVEITLPDDELLDE